MTPPSVIKTPPPASLVNEEEEDEDKPEIMRQETPRIDEPEEKPIELPRIPVMLAQKVPPIKYRDRSITFDVEYENKKAAEYEPVLKKQESEKTP